MSGTVSRGGKAGQQEVAGVAAQHTGSRGGRRRRRGAWVALGIVVVVAAGAVAGWRAGVFSPAASPGSGPQGAPAPATAAVTRQDLSATTPVTATLGYAGSWTVAGQGGGTLTWLPPAGRVIGQGQVLYQTGNGSPVVLLYGSVPDWRALDEGVTGPDVSQLNHDLVRLGYAGRADIAALGWDYYSWETAYAVQRLEEHLGVLYPPGSLSLGQVVFEPQALRVSQVTGSLGGPASGPVLTVTSDRQVVTVPLDVSDQSEVKAGDTVSITLPDGTTTPGVVSSVGTVVTTTPGQQGQGPTTTIPVYVNLRDPKAAGSLDQAPVTVNITTGGSPGPVLAVPVTALVAQASGGYEVEVAGPGNTRHWVPVQVGPVFDDTGGLVQVTGNLTPGQRVVVAAS
ncbi:MAG TPA: efflux RND transporter periplasmic adaptor subunit [Streptosporangiaceae bacterium]|nr:efflux RND transporter periplasmic adaptor subunit [Streptosporangiaceae bacterium]